MKTFLVCLMMFTAVTAAFGQTPKPATMTVYRPAHVVGIRQRQAVHGLVFAFGVERLHLGDGDFSITGTR
jgi:hypothetical protein